MDLFESKTIKPMLIGNESEPFDNKDYLFELKLDGERCVAYLGDGKTELRNKRSNRLSPMFLELEGLYKGIKGRCILDGELIVTLNGRPSFEDVARRSIMTNNFKIDLAAKQYPATYVAFDILYQDGKDLTGLPLNKRKEILQRVVKESEQLAVSRFIEERGIALYQAAEAQDLEGVVGKHRESTYQPGTRTKQWVKIKYLKDEDFVVAGYIPKENSVVSLVLGQYDDNKLIYCGHVTLGVSRKDFETIRRSKSQKTPPLIEAPKGNENAVWLTPTLVCVVKYMTRSESGVMRQPVYKGLRSDVKVTDCILPNHN